MNSRGKVYLVGAGPGDPELLTLKGARVLRSAAAVLYDNLANPELLKLTPPDAEHLYVGKKRSAHSYSQDEIIRLMIERAQRGLTVVRLKGGDPFTFGRGGEEVEGLLEAGIDYEVVPGVTTPLGIAAYTGVPLTHREHSSVVTFVTGHDIDSIDWRCAAGTVVVFMGLQHAAAIAQKMMDAGRSPDIPVMAVRWATRPGQQVLTATLGTIRQALDIAHLLPPVTLVIGEVAGLYPRLSWFEKRPLFGQRIIVTRAADQVEDFSARLRDLGAEPIELPIIELIRTEAELPPLEQYDWIVFTSVNAVQFFIESVRDLRAIRGRICAIGPATAAALYAARLVPDLVPQDSVSEGVAAAFAGCDLRGKKVLLPRAASARDVIPQALTAAGAHLDIVDLYRNVIPPDAHSRIQRWLKSGQTAHWIAFTSGSTVKNWLSVAGRESLHGVQVASIGPATSEVIRRHGITVDAEADPHTTDGIIDAITKCSL
jgi:uroporphyrinogen III methyltransferase / synthase